jgi:hypothetical protein
MGRFKHHQPPCSASSIALVLIVRSMTLEQIPETTTTQQRCLTTAVILGTPLHLLRLDSPLIMAQMSPFKTALRSGYLERVVPVSAFMLMVSAESQSMIVSHFGVRVSPLLAWITATVSVSPIF